MASGQLIPGDSDRPLRVCLVSRDYPTSASAAGGGIGAHTHSLAHATAALGHDVLVLTESDGPTEESRDGSVRVYALRRPSRRYWKLGRLVPVPWVRRSIAVWRALQHLHRERPFDFVRFPDGYGEGFRFSFSPLTPFEVHLHGPASILQRWDNRNVPRVRAGVEAWFERAPATRASLLIAGTRWFADLIAREWAIDSRRIRIIRNPLALETFRPAPLGLRTVNRTVLFAGHIQWFKGVSTLAAAIPRVIARYPDVDFKFIGSDTNTAPGGGSLRRFLEKMLAEAGVLERVTFLDPMPHRELVTHYQACRIFVLPSFQEVYGNVVLEAMACARPCVVTSTVGSSELIHDGDTGLIVPPDNPEALAGAISRLLAMPEAAREEVGARARRTVEQACAASVIAAQTLEVYREVLRASGARFATDAGVRP